MAPQVTYFITGTSRGIGLELVKQIAQNPDARIIATARNPAKSTGLQELQKKHPNQIKLLSLEVTDPEAVKKVAEEVAKEYPQGIDYLINNAGAAGTATTAQATKEEFLSVYETNVVGPFLVDREFTSLVKKSNKKTIVHLSTILGSVDLRPKLDGIPSLHSYRASKAALNMITANFAEELKADGVTVISIHPGWVETDMGSSLGKAPLTTEQSVVAQLKVVHGLKTEDNGKFYNYDGTNLPW